MNKSTLVFLFGMGVLLGISNISWKGESFPMYLVVAILAITSVLFVVDMERRRQADAGRALEILKDAQNLRIARKEVKSKIPTNSPRRDSRAAYEGSAKIGAVRSMAALVRKPRLREKIFEICDFADMVLETIRRMPSDTPAAVAFAENHLSKLTEALERCFEMNKCEEYRHAPASLDAQEIECFGTFITAFRKQQDNILVEGKNS
ncbi:MAG: hypothetical protein LBQ36_06590 [Synergistaceae bacterium]|jgi:hypothetical protein|nr:hypothetical protein [Synergistaceae bacterium]